MSEVNRYILGAGRELRTTMSAGRFIVAIHDVATRRVAQLAIYPAELGAFRRALGVLAVGQKRRRGEGT